MPRVKICGVRRPADVAAVIAAGADAIGLNFFPKSSRFVGDREAAQKLIDYADGARLEWCGVFVNASLDDVCQTAEALKLNTVQLHGDETPEFAQSVKQRLGSTKVWKALRIGSEADIAGLTAFACDGWVLDSKVDGVRGGSGKTFDWSLVSKINRTSELILSGGLHPDNVADAIRQTAPDWVDVASGVESAPGVKDAKLIAAFVAESRT
jgi:phosphoribosylanthranilate isomerase